MFTSMSGKGDLDRWDMEVIPGNGTVEGPASPLQVLTSKNRLYSN